MQYVTLLNASSLFTFLLIRFLDQIPINTDNQDSTIYYLVCVEIFGSPSSGFATIFRKI